jgi:hypothetical protein
MEMKRQAFPDFIAGLNLGAKETARLRQTLAAEFRYLASFRKFLEGTSLPEQYRLFDDALSVAPWNDSLRARIYAQYAYIASRQRDPAERARLMKRANDLYPRD